MTDARRLLIKLDDEVNMGHLEDVRRLLQQGADVNGRNVLGDTPLKAAAYTGQADMVRFLLGAGADPAATDLIFGRTALQWAQELSYEAMILAFAEEPRVETRGTEKPTVQGTEKGGG